MATIEELTGIVKGLADVVKSQLSSQHEAQEASRQHIDALAKAVSEWPPILRVQAMLTL